MFITTLAVTSFAALSFITTLAIFSTILDDALLLYVEFVPAVICPYRGQYHPYQQQLQ